MRVRLERYEMANRSTQSRSLLAFIFGGLGLVFFGFIAFMGLLMIAMPDREGGGLWAVRSGILLFFFIGVVPLGICALVITWGVKQRGRFRRLGELAAIARQTPMLTVPQVSHALRLTLADADRLILDAGSLGLIEPGDPVALAPTVAHAYAPSPYAATPTSEPPRPSGPPISTGAVLGDAYRIEEPLGQGGMGAVYAARHLRTGRRYAVKTMLAGASASEDAIRRFEREATAASAIGHPGIVQVHDCNVAPGGLFYLVMDLLEGETLEQRLARSPALPWAEAQRIAVELCAALGAAHAQGLLHRDIKPSNIFLAKGAQASAAELVVLVDFGLVKSTAEISAGLTSTGAV
ncbi:MAG TPA: serine/threonine-protein kinase, partial [Labilithrix sp.]|nr:serine/threonine-protein kinase [Labilithrix sp.]